MSRIYHNDVTPVSEGSCGTYKVDKREIVSDANSSTYNQEATSRNTTAAATFHRLGVSSNLSEAKDAICGQQVCHKFTKGSVVDREASKSGIASTSRVTPSHSCTQSIANWKAQVGERKSTVMPSHRQLAEDGAENGSVLATVCSQHLIGGSSRLSFDCPTELSDSSNVEDRHRDRERSKKMDRRHQNRLKSSQMSSYGFPTDSSAAEASNQTPQMSNQPNHQRPSNTHHIRIHHNSQHQGRLYQYHAPTCKAVVAAQLVNNQATQVMRPKSHSLYQQQQCQHHHIDGHQSTCQVQLAVDHIQSSGKHSHHHSRREAPVDCHHRHVPLVPQTCRRNLSDATTSGPLVESLASPPPQVCQQRRSKVTSAHLKDTIVDESPDKSHLLLGDDLIGADNGNQYYCYKHRRQRQLPAQSKQLVSSMRDHTNNKQHPSRAHNTTNIQQNAEASEPQSVSSSSPGTTRSTSTQFISQLYFLVHLSALLSLLLHHKNLTSSERRLTSAANKVYDFSMNSKYATLVARDLIDANLSPHSSVAPVSTFTDFTPSATDLLGSTTTATSTATYGNGYAHLPARVQPLPLPLPSTVGNNKETDFIAASTSPEQTLVPVTDSDILVRLVGRSHARHALRYFLTYMLSVSLVILINLWLVRVCSSRRRLISSKRLGMTALTANSSPICCDIDSMVRAGRAPGK